MMQTKEELVKETMDTYRAIFMCMKQATTSIWANLDLTLAQLKVMIILTQDGPSPIGQIADCLGIGLPTASHLVEKLVQAGFVERIEDTDDRRRTFASLTPAGVELAGHLTGNVDLMQNWLMEIDMEKLKGLKEGLEALKEASSKSQN